MTGRGWCRVGRWAVVCALLLPALGGWQLAAPQSAGAVPVWSAAAPTIAARTEHSATVLADGTVLLAGGDPDGTAERYDAETDRWAAAGTLGTPRYGHTATVLPNGQVLIVGGVDGGPSSDGQSALATAERYDPTTARWVTAAPLAAPRFDHTATLLRDGRVLVVGGAIEVGGSALASAEIYDPATDRWSPTKPFGTQRSRHTATLLSDGRVAIAGGMPNGRERVYLNTVEVFDPPSGQWTLSPGGFGEARAGHSAALLPNGQLLIAGGRSNFEGAYNSVEFVLATGEQRHPARLVTPRIQARTVTLPGGAVVLLGGTFGNDPPGAVERYDPFRHSWGGEAPLLEPRTNFAAVALPTGVIVVSGGVDVASGAATRGVERYQQATTPERCFSETAHCVRGPFAAYWQENGGLAINGYPLTDERIEVLEDGLPHIVQYFERVRLEYHPVNPAPYTILLGQFGRQILAAGSSHGQIAPAAQQLGADYFSATGHNLGGAFRDYWQGHGGLAQFGFPLTEEFTETLDDGRSYRVQYFERARFEYHPENSGPYDVLLGQFGRTIAAQAELLTGAFGYLYLASAEARTKLGPPLGPAQASAIATQQFERGQMYYRGDQRRIYVLGGARRALLGQPGGGAFFADTWREGEPSGGEPGPTAGTYTPRYGFGKVRREQEYVRAGLGYARSANETSATLLVQDFARGMLILNSDGQLVIALYLFDPPPCTAGDPCVPGAPGSYQCYDTFRLINGCPARAESTRNVLVPPIVP